MGRLGENEGNGDFLEASLGKSFQAQELSDKSGVNSRFPGAFSHLSYPCLSSMWGKHGRVQRMRLLLHPLTFSLRSPR